MKKEEVMNEKFAKVDVSDHEVRADSCPECGAPVHFGEGCSLCLECGYSKCG